MKKFNRKRLDNKGFTLVELLAVVVILAVVMGIAMTSVLSSMNNSRKGALSDSAISVKNAFTTKYSEAMVTGTASSIYGPEMDLSGNGYNFNTASKTSPVFYYLNEDLKDELNISPSTYELSDSADEVATVNTDNAVTDSFVAFNGNSVVVCMIAKKSGSYYVANFATGTSTTVFDKTITFAEGDMWACSTDGSNSWTSVSE